MSAYLACISTRSDIIRMAPVVHGLRARGHDVRVLHIGLHADTAGGLCHFFGMSPHARVRLPHRVLRLSQLTAEMLPQIDALLQRTAPDAVLVHGDTSSALTCALAAVQQDLPVAHIAGEPRAESPSLFPEAMNRRLIARIARWHFLHCPLTRETLLREGTDPDHIHSTGNTAIDAAQWAQAQLDGCCLHRILPADVLRFVRLHDHQQMLLVDAHQHENWGRPMQRIATALAGLLQLHPHLTAVWPLHTNPRVRADVQMGLAWLPAEVRSRLCLTEALPYTALIALLDKSCLILTDSHTLQEKASALKKPVMILRDENRPDELVEAGGAMIAGTMGRQIVEMTGELLHDPLLLTSMQLPVSPYGDGQAAHRVARILDSQSRSRLQIERQAA